MLARYVCRRRCSSSCRSGAQYARSAARSRSCSSCSSRSTASASPPIAARTADRASAVKSATETGTQPGASWDPVNGHWDVKGLGGKSGTRRFLPDGTEVGHSNNPVPNPEPLWDRIRDFFNQPVPDWFPRIPQFPPKLPWPIPTGGLPPVFVPPPV